MTSERWFPGVVRTWIEAAQGAVGGGDRFEGTGGLDDEVPVSAVASWLRGMETVGHAGVLRGVAGVTPESLGMFGFAWAARPTVGDGLRSLSRYFGLLDPALGLRWEDEGGLARVVLLRPDDGSGDPVTHLAVEFLFAYLAHRVGSVAGVPLSKVVFRHERFAESGAYGAVFSAPVEFGQEADGIVMPASLLGARLAPYDGPMGERVRGGVSRALKGFPSVQTTSVQVREVILEELMGGIPPMTRVASRLGMTVPVLAQLLRAEGETFAGLRDLLLYRLAQEYLEDRELALVDVAFATGFVDYGVFERTLARWSGRSLRSWREVV